MNDVVLIYLLTLDTKTESVMVCGKQVRQHVMYPLSLPVKQSATINVYCLAWLTTGPVSQALSAYCINSIGSA